MAFLSVICLPLHLHAVSLLVSYCLLQSASLSTLSSAPCLKLLPALVSLNTLLHTVPGLPMSPLPPILVVIHLYSLSSLQINYDIGLTCMVTDLQPYSIVHLLTTSCFHAFCSCLPQFRFCCSPS